MDLPFDLSARLGWDLERVVLSGGLDMLELPREVRGLLMDWTTTTIILQQMRDHDPAAWQEFCERFREPLLCFAQAQGLSLLDAEDTAQETLATFADTFRAGRYDRDRGRLSSWLFGIAHNKVQKARQQRQRRARVDGGQSPVSSFWNQVPDEEDAREAWDKAWQWSILQRCLRVVESEVQARTLEAFRRVALDQASVSEVAAELGMSASAVSVAKHRVLKRVRELKALLEDEVAST